MNKEQNVEGLNVSPAIAKPMLNEGSFSVHSYSLLDMDNADKWGHWSKGLKMIIQKNGVTMKLEEDEIRQLVKCLPRTFGGSY